MQLTGRGLGLALGACIVAGLGFGVVTTAVAGVAGSAPAPAATPSGSSPVDAAGLGDEVATYPLPVASSPTVTTPPSTAVPGPTLRLTPPPTLSASAVAPTPTPTVSTVPATATTATPTVTHTQPARVTTVDKGHPPRTLPSMAPSAPWHATSAHPSPASPSQSPGVTRPTGGWHPPALGVGAHDVTPPQLTSGADVGMVLLCSPSTACDLAGGTLTIGPNATSVSVSWSAPAARGHRAWQASTEWYAP